MVWRGGPTPPQSKNTSRDAFCLILYRIQSTRKSRL